MKITDQYDPTLRPVKGPDSTTKTKTSKTTTETTSGGDTVELSSMAKDVSKARTAVDQTSDVRTEKVEALKEKVISGEYKVDADKVAQKMVDEHLSELV